MVAPALAMAATVAYPLLAPTVGRVHYLFVEYRHGIPRGGVGICEAIVRPGTGKRMLVGVTGSSLVARIQGVEIREEGGRIVREVFLAACECVDRLLQELGLIKNFLITHDVQVYFGEIAVPKEGPSAGVAMAIALFSAAINVPVRGDVAVTGEVSPRGALVKILGVRHKVEAALKAGMRTVIIPADNAPDALQLPWWLRSRIQIIAAPDIKVALLYALGPNGPFKKQYLELARQRAQAVRLAQSGRVAEAIGFFRVLQKRAPWDLSLQVWLDYLSSQRR